MLQTPMFITICILIQIELSRTATIEVNRFPANRQQKQIIEGSMDLRQNPCNNFYEFACGNWDEVYLEAGDKYYEPITLLDYNVNKELSNVFNGFSLKDKPKFIQEAYKYYTSCKNMNEYKTNEYLMWLKENDQFKWPALSPAITAKKSLQYDWLKMLAKMRLYGFNDVFIQQIVRRKLNDTKKFIIDLDKPVVEGGFNALTFVQFKIILTTMPLKLTNDHLGELWLEITEFEQKLLDLEKIEDVEVYNMEERLIYFKDLPFKWLKDYIKLILNQTDIEPKMELYIQNKPYMQALDNLLKTFTSRFLSKYLKIRFLWHLYKAGPSNFLDIDCLANTRSLMPTAMHWLYEHQHPELLREYDGIYEMFNNVRKHFNETVISNKHGFNTTVIQYLQNKINNMKLKLNNVPRPNTLNILEKFYESLNLHTEKFYENHLQLLRFKFQAHLALLQTKEPILDYTYLENEETGSTSSPYFLQSVNTVFLPLTLLQQPIYTPGLEDIYKYSSLGFLLAHEMFHGFDDTGIVTNADGTMSSFQFDDNPLFNATFKCLLEMNPIAISEKIADTSGLYYAYKAYFAANPNDIRKQRTIHGHQIASTKLFFLSFAQFFCGNTSSDVYETTVDHGSDRDRVTDVLKHFPEFSKIFQCNKRDRLYPHEECRLW